MQIKNKKQVEDISNQGNLFMKVEKGETIIRPMSEVHVVKEHRTKVDGKWRFIACPTENARMLIAAGESQSTDIPPCPLCELGYPVQTAFMAVVLERQRTEYNKKGEKIEIGGDTYVLKKGPTLLGEIQNLLDDENWGRAWNYDVKINATGDGLLRKYSIVGIPADKCQPLTTKETTSFNEFKEKVDINQMTIPRSYDEINKIIGELFPDYDTVKDQYEQDNKPK